MRQPHDVTKAYSLLVNREIARRLLDDPSLLAEAQRVLAAMDAPHQRAAVLRWSHLLDQPPSVIAETLSRDDEEGDYVRETRPAFIVVDIDTRMRLLDEARRLVNRS